LADIAAKMSEPCIMDVKIGQRTWDPLATKEKREAEEQKYVACRKAYSLCIPGFQVYSAVDGNIYRYGRDYGKKLDEHTLKDGELRYG
jgi:1D-myo-inositol-tetrakisphosphate 5-kinase/inositol-polyphosphate multikinase